MLKEIQNICHHLNKSYNYLTQMNWQYLYQELLKQNYCKNKKKQLENRKIFLIASFMLWLNLQQQSNYQWKQQKISSTIQTSNHQRNIPEKIDKYADKVSITKIYYEILCYQNQLYQYVAYVVVSQIYITIQIIYIFQLEGTKD
ncbi:unnamed protein product [Paramecium sonneborni]|uniref:Transmembrane protein n=1 Tax=Paramecium sonneborni TaxID=65129 RepID=A0A8S1RPU3_9CILI|nr:unnamed protein product [Paramecium sonneborni]